LFDAVSAPSLAAMETTDDSPTEEPRPRRRLVYRSPIFSPFGRIGRPRYLLTVGILLLIEVVTLCSEMPGVAILACLFCINPTSHRLHDAGRTGLWNFVWLAGATLAWLVRFGGQITRFGQIADFRPDGLLIFGLLGVQILAFGAVAALRSDPQDNRFGVQTATHLVAQRFE
jgi:uncharacterized membrane protein YhaH (DUF805 family)